MLHDVKVMGCSKCMADLTCRLGGTTSPKTRHDSPITESSPFKSDFKPLLHIFHLLALRQIKALEPDLMVYFACRRQLLRVPHVENDALLVLENTIEESERQSQSARQP